MTPFHPLALLNSPLKKTELAPRTRRRGRDRVKNGLIQAVFNPFDRSRRGSRRQDGFFQRAVNPRRAAAVALAAAAALIPARAGETFPYAVPSDILIIDPDDAPGRTDEQRRLRAALDRGAAHAADARAAQARAGLSAPLSLFDDIDRVLASGERLALQPAGDAAEFRKVVAGLEDFVDHLARLSNLWVEWRERSRDAGDLQGHPLWTTYENRLGGEIEWEIAQLSGSVAGKELAARAELSRREKLDALQRLRVEVAGLSARLSAARGLTAYGASGGRAPPPREETEIYDRFAASFEAGASAEAGLLLSPRDVPERITSLARPGPVEALRVWRRFFDVADSLIRAGVILSDPAPAAPAADALPPSAPDGAHPPDAATPSLTANAPSAADDSANAAWRSAAREAAAYAASLPADADAMERFLRLEGAALRAEAVLAERAKALSFLRDAEEWRGRLKAAGASAGEDWGAFAPAAEAGRRLDEWIVSLSAAGDPLLSAKAEGDRARIALLVEASEAEAALRRRERDALAPGAPGLAEPDVQAFRAALEAVRQYAAERLEVNLHKADLAAEEMAAAARRRAYDREAEQWEEESEPMLRRRIEKLLGGDVEERFPWLLP